MPCVIWYGAGPCVKSPMIVPMIEPTAWPPSAGAASTITTRRPRRAASSAADTPAMPAPTTQMSAEMVDGSPRAERRSVRVFMVTTRHVAEESAPRLLPHYLGVGLPLAAVVGGRIRVAGVLRRHVPLGDELFDRLAGLLRRQCVAHEVAVELPELAEIGHRHHRAVAGDHAVDVGRLR